MNLSLSFRIKGSTGKNLNELAEYFESSRSEATRKSIAIVHYLIKQIGDENEITFYKDGKKKTVIIKSFL